MPSDAIVPVVAALATVGIPTAIVLAAWMLQAILRKDADHER